MDPITSPHNPLIKRIRSLRRRKAREREGLCFVEGLRAVEEALASRVPVERLIYSPGRLSSERALETVRRLYRDGLDIVTVAETVFDALSDREEGQGLGAVVRIPARTLADIPAGPGTVVLALVEPRDPGNVGSVIRTADAAGAAGVAVIGTAADPYDPKSVRASMGSLFALPVVQVPALDALIDWALRHRLRTVASSARAARSCFDSDLSGPLALVLGPERGGLDPRAIALCDEAVRIPMRGQASSLNLAVSAGILVYEAFRQSRPVEPPSQPRLET